MTVPPAVPASTPWWKWPGLYAWLSLNVVATALFYEQFDAVSTALVVNAVAGAWATVNRFVRKEAVESIKETFTRMLESWRFAYAAFGISFVMAAAGFFVSSVHVTAGRDLDAPITLYRVEEPLDHPELARVVDSAVIEEAGQHADFRMMPRGNRNVWLTTSHFQTQPLPLTRWKTQRLVYPRHFQPIVSVSLLPWDNLLIGVRPTKPLRIVVREVGPAGLTLAETTLVDQRRMPGLVLSLIKPPPIDSVTRVRWRDSTSRLVPGAPAADVNTIVANWADFWWIRPRRVLKAGDTLEVVVSKGGSQILSQRVNVEAGGSYVFVGRT